MTDKQRLRKARKIINDMMPFIGWLPRDPDKTRKEFKQRLKETYKK